MRILDTIEVKQNLSLIVRERGKIVDRRDGHNIWVDLGREYLAGLIAFQSFSPDTPEDPPGNNRVKYMGLGIGGTNQLAPGTADSAPLVTAYPGTNVQTDTDPTVTQLERPVRVSGGVTNPPYAATDVWLGQVQAPAVHGTATETTFRRSFTVTEVSYSTFLTVPLSEVGLYTSAANPLIATNTFIAYDTFDTLSKTNAFELEVAWTIRF
jgi:hypothetical protein